MTPVATLVDALERGAANRPDQTLYRFLDVDGRERDHYTYLAFHERTRHLAEHLRREAKLKRGDRVLLVYPPGLEVIVAFLACSRIGAIPVPVYPPTPMNFEAGMAKLAFIASDCAGSVDSSFLERSCSASVAARARWASSC